MSERQTKCADRNKGAGGGFSQIPPRGDCVYDSQGGFTCPGAASYRDAWEAQQRAEACRVAWHDRWVHAGDTPLLTYDMGYVDQVPCSRR